MAFAIFGNTRIFWALMFFELMISGTFDKPKFTVLNKAN